MRSLFACLIAFTYSLPAAPKLAVATVDSIATDAAVAAMNQGGNAIDGAVAAGLTLGVVNGYNSGIGGGCFVMLHLANGKIIAIDGREMAPAAARPDMFLENGKPNTHASKVGALASGVPGALAAYAHALKIHGKLPLKWHLENAAKIAETGFPLPEAYARTLKRRAPDLALFKASANIFLNPDLKPWPTGKV